MKVNFSKNISFSRLLKPHEYADYRQTLNAAKEKIGQTGKSIFIMPDISLPQEDKNNTGVGNMASKEASDFFDFMKLYLGINTVEILPHGEVNNKRGCFNIYSGSSLSISDSRINLNLLTTEKYGNILDQKDVEEAVKSNNFPSKESIINFENVFLPEGGVQKTLRKAFENFNKLNDDHKIKKEFISFKNNNYDRLFPKSIYKILENNYKDFRFKNWPDETDKNLFNPDFNKELRDKRLKEITSNNKDIEFYMFKQFLAEKHLDEGKKMLNDKGLKLFGDVPIAFSYDEVWANPKAFIQNAYIGSPFWHLTSLNFNDLNDDKSPASQMLKKKIQFFAKKYDGLRIDCGWCYVNPSIYYFEENNRKEKFDFNDKILNKIENWIVNTKGKNFDKKDIIYEFEADPKDFQFIKSNNINPVLKNRVSIFNSIYLDKDWGSNQGFLKQGFKPDEFCLGVGNHDALPLRQVAYNVPQVREDEEVYFYKNKQVHLLSKIFKIAQSKLVKPTEFVKVKFAEPMSAKNNHVFFMDVFGRAEKYDNIYPRTWLVYRPKLSKNYKIDYENALRSQFGLNIMDAISKVFKLKNLDKKEKDLYERVNKYRDILYE